MKILNVFMSLDPVNGGGGVERTYQLSKSLIKAGHQCSVLTTDLGLTKERIASMNGVHVIALTSLNKRFYFPKFSFKEIRKTVEDADIVHFMGHWTLLNAIVFKAVQSLKKPYCVCPAGSLPIYGRSKFLKLTFNFLIGRKIIRSASAHIGISVNEIEQYKEYGVSPQKISIIPNGINPEDLNSRDIAHFRDKIGVGNSPFILFVGRLNSIKGPDLLLKAFCQIKDQHEDVHLVFVGPDGGMLKELKQVSERLSVNSKVHFIGYLGGKMKATAYHAADLLAIPSRQEAMSIVVLEAGITATPVILTNRCGFNQVADIGGGVVVNASVVGLKKGLLELLSNRQTLKKLGLVLEKYVRENYTWDSIIQKHIQLFNDVLSKKKESDHA
jgi:glycosyltransferase involved in cell wall biosynthesis